MLNKIIRARLIRMFPVNGQALGGGIPCPLRDLLFFFRFQKWHTFARRALIALLPVLPAVPSSHPCERPISRLPSNPPRNKTRAPC